MPKKSRRNRAKGGAAGTGRGASGVGSFNSSTQRGMDLVSYCPDRDRKVALWMYEWSAAKDRLMKDILDALAEDPRIHALFDPDCLSPTLVNLLEYSTANFVTMTSGSTPHSLLDATALAATKPLLVEAANMVFRNGCKTSLPPLQRRKKYVEGIIDDARGLMAIGRGDVAAALCNFGLNCEQTKIFCDAFLAEWDCNIHSSDAFVDGKAKRAMKIISENETNPMHTRAHALVLRGMMSHEFEECPSPATAAYFRRALRYSRKIEAGEMRSIDFVLQGVSLQLDVKERVELNLDVAKRLLSFYEGPGACVGMTLLERISHFDRSFPCIPNYLAIGGAQCDHCGKTAEEAGLPCLHKCKQCRMALYCSVECQAARWSGGGHREHCKKFGRFGVGDKLVLFGLKKRSDLNTSLVEVVGKTMPHRLNVRICFPPEHEGTVVAAKKTNLRHHRPMR